MCSTSPTRASPSSSKLSSTSTSTIRSIPNPVDPKVSACGPFFRKSMPPPCVRLRPFGIIAQSSSRTQQPDPVPNAEGRYLTLIARLEGQPPNLADQAPRSATDRRLLASLKDELVQISALSPQDRGYAFVAFAKWSEYLQGNSESCNILAHLVGRHSTIRRIASRHYSAEGLLRMCRRPKRANLMRLQAAFASK